MKNNKVEDGRLRFLWRSFVGQVFWRNYVDQLLALQKNEAKWMELAGSLIVCPRPDAKKVKSVRSQMRKIWTEQELLIQKLPRNQVVSRLYGVMICMHDFVEIYLHRKISKVQGALKEDTERLLTARLFNRIKQMEDSLYLSRRHYRSQAVGRKGQQKSVVSRQKTARTVLERYKELCETRNDKHNFPGIIALELGKSTGHVARIIRDHRKEKTCV